MRISDTMCLNELAARMGADATTAEAAHMRAALDGLGRWTTTDQVPESEWLKLCDAAAAQAALD